MMRIPGRIIIAVALACATSVGASDLTKQDITVANGEVRLAATILMPAGAGPHPGMVLIGGSGPSTRGELKEIAEGFAGHGVATLAYDKRGAGESAGNWVTSSLEELATDAVAAFARLARQPGVDAASVGYLGISQGGWVVPIAANISSAAFGIAISGGGLTPREIETANYLNIARHAGGDAGAEADVEHMLDAYFGYLAGELTRSQLEQVLEPLRAQPWFEATGINRVIPGERNRSNWAWVANYDPRETIAGTRVPILVLLGENDPLTPAAGSASAWRAALGTRHDGSEVIVIPGAGHGLRTGMHGGSLIPEYFSLQLDWLDKVGIGVR